MEHRQFTRKRVSVVVKLIVKGKVVAITRVVEISRDGMKIINPGMPLKKNQMVEIGDTGRDGARCAVLKAMVVHASKYAAGLCLINAFPAKRSNLFSKNMEDVDTKQSGISGVGVLQYLLENQS